MFSHTRHLMQCIGAIGLIILFQGLLFPCQSAASPLPTLWAGIIKRYTGDITPQKSGIPGSPSVSDWPTDDQIRADFIRPNQNSYVFFSEITHPEGSERAREFADEIGGVVVETAFPRNYVCRRNGDRSWWGNFVDRVSGIFSDYASGNVYLVTNSMDGLRFPCSVFNRVERPSLLANFHTQIHYVDANNFHNQVTFSLATGQRLHNKRESLNETFSIMSKSNVPSSSGYCFNWEGYGDDPNGLCETKILEPKYAPGRCGIHIVQHTANKAIAPIAPDWAFNITLKDSNREIMGNSEVEIHIGTTYDLSSKLPLSFHITPGTQGIADGSPLKLAYGGWNVLTRSPACSVGGYNNGWRQMDCGFPCA